MAETGVREITTGDGGAPASPVGQSGDGELLRDAAESTGIESVASIRSTWSSRLDRRPFRPLAARLVPATLAPLALAGCLGSDHEPVRTASSVDRAAAVLVTPTMVAPWREVSDALSPNFTMTGDAAVAKALPTTERVQDQVLRALGLSLAVGLPGSSSTSTTTLTRLAGDKSATDAAGVTTSSTAENGSNSTSTDTRTAGVVPTAPNGAPASAALPASAGGSGDLGIDPVLQYKAANYLHQSVQLLNREVQSAAQRSCYEPYVVKLKLAVMPYRPNLGYDLHTRIAFFQSNGSNPFGPLRGQPDAAQTAARSADACVGIGHVPVVVPLLAADDLQMAARAKAVEEAQQIGLALNLMVHGVGAGAGANRLNQSLRGILNHDLSSSLTISREADNTLYVRIAANNVASGEPSLVGQTYDVAVLLLVPRGFFSGDGATTVAIETFTEFRDSTDGAVLDRRSDERTVERSTQLLQPLLRQDQRSRWEAAAFEDRLAWTRTVSGAVQTGDYASFLAALTAPFKACGEQCPAPVPDPLFAERDAPRVGPALWTALSALIADSSFKGTLLELPRPTPIRAPVQTVFLQDDGKEVATAVVGGVAGYASGTLRASLRIAPVDAKGRSQPPVVIPAQGVAFDAGAQSLTLTFPSLAKLGLAKTAASGNALELALSPCDAARRLCAAINGGPGPTSYDLRVVATAPAAAKPASFVLTAATPTIVIQHDSEGLGHASLRIAKLPAGRSAVLAVAGAEVTGMTDGTGASVPAGPEGFPIAQNGTYVLALRGLRDEATVTVTGQELRSGAKLGTTSLSLRAASR